MKRLIITMLLLGFTATLGGCQMAGHNPHTGKIRHVVMFKFKDDATAEQVAAIEKHFAQLKHDIPEIVDYEWGTNNSPEGLADGFTHCFLVTFNNDAGRAIYLPHPAHKDFVTHLKPILDKVMVIDYTVKTE